MPISMEEKVFPRALYWIAKGDSHFVVDPDCGGREPPLTVSSGQAHPNAFVTWKEVV